MKMRKWMNILMGAAAVLILSAGMLLFAEEILAAKKALYTTVTKIRQHTAGAEQNPLQEQFGDYVPMAHSGDAWYQNTRLIYHAAGTVDGLVYTNSREALQNTLDHGGNAVEIDFLFTSDGHLICAHTWEDLYALEPLTLQQVLDVGIYRKYTPMTAADLVEIMQQNPQLTVVVDTKEEKPAAVLKELVRLCNEDERILQRFVIQLYDRGMKAELLEIYPFQQENFLFTAYKFGNERVDEILRLCYDEQIQVVTVVYYAWSEDVIRLFREKGIFVFEHTVNDAVEARDLIARGSQGIYTDFLQPEDLEPVE